MSNSLKHIRPAQQEPPARQPSRQERNNAKKDAKRASAHPPDTLSGITEDVEAAYLRLWEGYVEEGISPGKASRQSKIPLEQVLLEYKLARHRILLRRAQHSDTGYATDYPYRSLLTYGAASAPRVEIDPEYAATKLIEHSSPVGLRPSHTHNRSLRGGKHVGI
jgi:hypothetical protein